MGARSSSAALAAEPNRGAMDTKTNAPSFTVSLRGYDREEVDEYLDSLAEALGQVEEAEAHSRRLQAHVAKCNTRIKELEDRIRADTPKTGIALGERIGLLLHEAEEAAVGHGGSGREPRRPGSSPPPKPGPPRPRS